MTPRCVELELALQRFRDQAQNIRELLREKVRQETLFFHFSVLYFLKFKVSLFLTSWKWRHDTLPNDNQPKNTQSNDTQPNDTQLNDTLPDDTQLIDTQHNKIAKFQQWAENLSYTESVFCYAGRQYAK